MILFKFLMDNWTENSLHIVDNYCYFIAVKYEETAAATDASKNLPSFKLCWYINI